MNFKCPFHNDDSPSFCIKKKNYYCYGCNIKGKFKNIKSINLKNFSYSFNKNLILDSKFSLFKKKNYWLNYLIKRKMNFNTINRFNLGCVDFFFKKKNKINNIFKNKLIFPILNEENFLCGVGLKTNDKKNKYLNIYRKNYNKKNVIYGINEKYNNCYTIVVEGYFDLLTLYKNNIYNVTSILGCFIDYELILKLLTNFKFVYFCLDGDIAGYLSLLNIKKIKKEKKIRNLICKNLPLSYDPDNYIKRFGIKSFLKYMNL